MSMNLEFYRKGISKIMNLIKSEKVKFDDGGQFIVKLYQNNNGFLIRTKMMNEPSVPEEELYIDRTIFKETLRKANDEFEAWVNAGSRVALRDKERN